MAHNKKGHGEEHEEHADESWLIPYADLLTLLLALFIVLFASSTVDQEKFAAIQAAMYTAFGGQLTEGGGIAVPEDFEWPDFGPGGGDGIDGAGDDEGDPGAGLEGAMGNLYGMLKSYVIDNDLNETVVLEVQGESLLITLRNDIWFASGSADLSPAMREKVTILAEILRDTQDEDDPFEIIVAGHTDNSPISTARFPSNLYLSLIRAANFHDRLVTESGLDPAFFSSRGYGEERPIATNDTPEGKALNRRVELLIMQTKTQLDD